VVPVVVSVNALRLAVLIGPDHQRGVALRYLMSTA
jgi:hypothetical protein